MARLIPDNVLAAITIWGEARGEPFEGKVGVAEVIRNRMTNRFQSDGTVAGTVLARKQFSVMNDSDPNRILAFKIDGDDPVVKQCLNAWNVAMSGSDLVHGAVHYVNEELVKKWYGRLPMWFDERKVVARIGNHTFMVL